jgi:hypothetical protein
MGLHTARAAISLQGRNIRVNEAQPSGDRGGGGGYGGRGGGRGGGGYGGGGYGGGGYGGRGGCTAS